jgi:hypothetical protein
VAAAWAILFPAVALAVLFKPVLKMLDVRVWDYVRVLRTPVAASLLMVASVIGLTHLLDLPPVWTLVVKVVFGAACYVALVSWWEGNPYHEFRRLLADTRAGATR